MKSKSLRIAMLAYTEYPYDPRVRREAEILAQCGHQVHVIATRSGPHPASLHLGGVNLHEVPLEIRRGSKPRYLYQYLSFLLTSTLCLLRLHERVGFDVVHVHSLPDFQVFCSAPLKLARVPVVLDLHELMPEMLEERFSLSRDSFWVRGAIALEKHSCRFADHIIVANDAIRQTLVARGLPAQRLTSVYNAADEKVRRADPRELSRSLHLPQGKLIVHAGGVNPERDLETVIRATSLIASELNAYLVVAGNGSPDYLNSLKAVAAELHISDRVLFVGRLSPGEANALMSLASVGLVSAERNPITELGWPTRIIEFASLKKPLLVADLRFIRSVLGDNAVYYEPGNAKSLAAGLRRLLASPRDSDEYVSRAEAACSRFGLSHMQEGLTSVYGEVLS